ncbi:ANTAR domain-containing response regulator [Simplicispira psychrophila]|uniref:ANTAR domain-containing response regulator n=1 Tax=Simplicispira psychrophila TaxID=80882 RepID=UPI0009FE474F|nr:response regulator [Simplicispira psychrophila]
MNTSAVSATTATVATIAAPAHLLLVDDNRLILATMAAGLRAAGYRTSTAESVDDAEALLTSGVRPDLVILDMHMPGHSGLALAQRLRDLQHLPFLVFSAYSDSATVEHASHLGALSYMVKPLAISQIRPTIEAALQRARELHALRQTRQQLQEALDGDRDINVATGITMVQYRLQRSAAFDLLRSAARTQRRKIAHIAVEIIQNSEKLHCQ